VYYNYTISFYICYEDLPIVDILRYYISYSSKFLDYG